MTKGLTIKIAKGSIVTIAATILLSALFWFLPHFLLGGNSAEVPILFMGIEILALPDWLSRLLAFLTWGVVWYLLNMKCNELKIIPVRSAMVFILGMAFCSTIPIMQRFDGTMIAFLLFLTSFMNIFGLYDVRNQVTEVYRIMLLVLASSLFAPSYAWLSCVMFLGLLNFKVGSFRILMSILLAIVTVAWLVWGICFCLGKTAMLMAWANSMLQFSLPSLHGSIICMVSSVLLLLAVITVIVAVNGISHTFDARVRLNCSFFYLAFFFTVAFIVFFPAARTGMLPGIIVIATVLSALYFSVAKSKFADTLFLIFIGLMIIYRVAVELPFLNLGILGYLGTLG